MDGDGWGTNVRGWAPMKVLLSSHLFYPSVGGVESVGLMLAEALARSGMEVRVVTQTRGEGEPLFPFAVLREPSPAALWRAVAWSDLVLHNNISLQTAWPLLGMRRPWLIVHHTWIARPDGSRGWKDILKRLVLRGGRSIAISAAVAEALPVPARLIPDPYDDELFCEWPGAVRARELIFVGRLVSDKGVDLLIDALGNLKEEGLAPGLTVVGNGPELGALQAQAERKGVLGQIRFAGWKTGRELVGLMNQHQILVVPSRWREPFGLVALEGIACGCVVVGSAGGGLKEAIGPCGVTFANGDVQGLTGLLSGLFRRPETLEIYRGRALEHLARHRREAVARAYVEAIEEALGGTAGARRGGLELAAAGKSGRP